MLYEVITVRDQIQDLFIGIWDSRQGLGDVKNLKAYLFVSLRRRLFAKKKETLNLGSLTNIQEEDCNTLFFENSEFIDKEYVITSYSIHYTKLYERRAGTS